LENFVGHALSIIITPVLPLGEKYNGMAFVLVPNEVIDLFMKSIS
jgi:hypothetical protein